MAITRAIGEHLRRLRRDLRALGGNELRLTRDVRLPAVRLGSDYGGWLVSEGYTKPSCLVFSVGVGTDISFDLAMIQRYGATVHAFDPTPKSVQWIERQQLPPQFVFHPVGLAHFDGEMVFRLARADHTSYSTELHISGHAVDEVRRPVKRLSTLAAQVGCQAIDILKLDIEGGEYQSIPDVLDSGVRVGQLLVELHYDATPAQLQRAGNLVKKVRAAGFRLFARSAVGRELSFIHESLL